MKIVEITTKRLVLTKRPWLTWIMFGVITVSLSLGIIRECQDLSWALRAILLFSLAALSAVGYQLAKLIRVTFDRSTGRIIIARRSIFGWREEAYSLRYFRHARVDAARLRGYDEGRTTRVILEFDETMLALMAGDERARLKKLRHWGFRETAPNEIPLTAHYSGIDDNRKLADRINDWANAGKDGPTENTSS